MKIKKGDSVKILAGKDSGKTATIERVFAKKLEVLMPNINLSKRHIKKQGQIEGGILDLPKPLDLSNVALICPNCKKETRVGYLLEDGKKIRVCRKCDKPIDKGGK